MDLKQTLIGSLPKKYRGRVKEFFCEDGLIDGCRYMLIFNEPYSFCECESVPVRNITEARRFVRESSKNDL